MDLDAVLDSIESSVGMTHIDIKSNKIATSTGLLCLDLILSGGLITGGWYTMFGGEQCAKSTLVMTQIARAINLPIPYIMYFDYEGSFQSDYFLSIARHVGAIDPEVSDQDALHKIFGLRNEKGVWLIPPRVRYYSMSIGEQFFDYVARLERSLPDKLYKDKKWWLVYENTKESKKILDKSKKSYDENMFKATGKYWVETDNGYPQALIALDSYPAMNPAKMDEDEISSGMSVKARMFSEHIPRIKGRMATKRITLLGVNQLRLKPGVSYGSPEYEPGGESLKYNSDVRIRMASRSVLGGSGQIEEEEGIDGGTDQYRYVHMRAFKNKISVPNLESWARIWTRDANGVAHGFDPVFDSYYFMKELGILTGTKNRIRINLPKMEGHKPLSWINFKRLIIGDKNTIKNVLADHGISKPFYLRNELFKLFDEGKAMDMYFSKRKSEVDGKSIAPENED